MHQDWLVVSGAGELPVDGVDRSLELPSDEDDDDDDASGVLVAGDVVVLAVVVEPIEPSNAITPQARTNADNVAAITPRRIRATRRARSARRARPRAARSGGVCMRPS
jgi:hypothetical protein